MVNSFKQNGINLGFVKVENSCQKLKNQKRKCFRVLALVINNGI